MVTLIVRTIIIYILLLSAIRLMGKRQVGEFEVSELVITFMLSELAVMPIANTTVPVVNAIVPVVLLLSLEIVFTLLTSKSAFCRRIMLGKPNIIIKKGKLDMKELSRLRLSVAELMSELRLKGVSSLDEVDYAIVEDNGQLSVFKTAATSPVTPSDIGKPAQEKGIAHCVISDGRVSASGLKDACRDRAWLDSELTKRSAAVLDVCVMTVDDGGNILIILKDGTKLT